MIYKAILGNKYIINDFIEKVELRLEHNIVLPADIYKYDRNTVIVDTPLLYKVGQPVSIGGYPEGGKNFRMLELSITDFPVLENSYISEVVYDSTDIWYLKPSIESILNDTTEKIPKPKQELMVIKNSNKGE
ncbi:hypothetical protein QUE06_00870 [Lactococcus lactis]|uniref:hypothetical protein n=1 Tax=Lactococcus lactis TaxID=1358 RepID=UPI0025A241C3|nr:hypothetical protein [Lactococcus lactis]MDM7533515.1 hypothetical protein [Lactococcus lactis]